MTILCSACGVIDAHEPHCPFFHQQKSFEKRDAKAPPMVTTPTPVSALAKQVAGNHYKDKKIQPVEYIHANKLGFLEGCIVKRITRWRDKPAESRFQDLEKIKHEVDLLIELESRK
jgi:hypothetical protein